MRDSSRCARHKTVSHFSRARDRSKHIAAKYFPTNKVWEINATRTETLFACFKAIAVLWIQVTD